MWQPIMDPPFDHLQPSQVRSVASLLVQALSTKTYLSSGNPTFRTLFQVLEDFLSLSIRLKDLPAKQS